MTLPSILPQTFGIVSIVNDLERFAVNFCSKSSLRKFAVVYSECVELLIIAAFLFVKSKYFFHSI